MRRFAATTVLWIVLLGFSPSGTSKAFRTRSRTTRCRIPDVRSVAARWPRPESHSGAALCATRPSTAKHTRTFGTIRAPTLAASALCGLLFAGSVGYRVLRPGIWGSINSFFKDNPFIASFLICAFKASSADWFAQVVSFRKSLRDNKEDLQQRSSSMPLDFRRNLALLCYGGLYQGCCQELIYNTVFSALFGSGTNAWTVAKKVSFDMLFLQPGLSLPIAYLIKAPIMGQSLTEAMRRYFYDVRHKSLWIKCWAVWTPTQIVSFAVIPTHFRITFMACVSFFWIILFSTISASGGGETTTTTADST